MWDVEGVLKNASAKHITDVEGVLIHSLCAGLRAAPPIQLTASVSLSPSLASTPKQTGRERERGREGCPAYTGAVSRGVRLSRGAQGYLILCVLGSRQPRRAA